MYRSDMTVNVSVHWSWLLSVWGLLFLHPTPAFACSCKQEPDPQAATDAAAAVFEGLVEAVGHDDTGNRQVTFSVVRTFKGISREHLTILTSAESHPCAISFKPQTGYLVFADGEPLTVAPCSRTRPAAQARDDLQALGPGSIPVDIPAEPNPDTGAADEATKSALENVAVRPAGGCASCNALTSAPTALTGTGYRLAWLAWLAPIGCWLLRRKPARPGRKSTARAR